MEDITIKEEAAEQIDKLLSEEEERPYALRIFVVGGGCSGFQYVWGLSEEVTHARIQWSKPIEDILLLDPMAEMYVTGSEIDYVEELGASFLKLVNPTATSHCGCGESFGV